MYYSHTKGIKKGLIAVVLFGIPVLIQILPQAWMNLTLGGLFTYLLNYLKYNLS